MTLEVQQAVTQAETSLRNTATKTHGVENANEKELGKQDFLNLMMTQLSNQDPLDPMDSEKMMQQMTALGTVEQLQNMNAQLAKMANVQQGIGRASAFAYIDKDVEVGTDTLPVKDGGSLPASYTLQGNADKVFVHIVNQEGEPIRMVKQGSQSQGVHSFTWDGTDNEGDPVPDGLYQYQVVATTEDGEKIGVDQFKKGRVSSVNFENGQPIALINGEKVPLNKVKGVSRQSERQFDAALPFPIKQTLQPKPLIFNPQPLDINKQ